MGRPRARISAEQVAKLARLGCTQEEIADVLGCSQQTISGRFSVEYARARASLKTSLRRAQVRRAVKDRSDAMLIHLGKVYLGQAGAGDGSGLAEILGGLLAPTPPGAGDDGGGGPGEVPR